jgi:hypothetical protein
VWLVTFVSEVCYNYYLPRSRIHTWKVYFRDKLYTWRSIGVCGTTVNVETVNAVLMSTLENTLVCAIEEYTSGNL